MEEGPKVCGLSKEWNAESILINLINIEEGLRFEKTDIFTIKDSIEKSINLFYEIQNVFTMVDQQLFTVVKKLMECMAVAFNKLFTMCDDSSKQIKKAAMQQKAKSDQNNTVQEQSKSKQPHTLGKMGGCTVETSNRGMDVIRSEVIQVCACSKNPLLKTSDVVQEDNIEWDITEQQKTLLNIGKNSLSTSSFMSLIESHISTFRQRPSTSYDSSIQLTLMGMLRYFSDCEKEVSQFLNKRALELPITIDSAYIIQEELEAIKRSNKEFIKNAIRIFEEISKKSKTQITKLVESQEKQKISHEVEKQQQTIKRRFRYNSEGTQTMEPDNSKAVQQYAQELAAKLEEMRTERDGLIKEVRDLRQILEQQTIKNRRHSELAFGLKTELESYKQNLKPMQKHIDSLTVDYNKVTNKLQSLMETNIQEMLEGKQFPEEVRHQLADILQNLVGKVQIDESSSNAKRKRFKFRIGRVKALEKENLSESFMQEIKQIKNKRAVKGLVGIPADESSNSQSEQNDKIISSGAVDIPQRSALVDVQPRISLNPVFRRQPAEKVYLPKVAKPTETPKLQQPEHKIVNPPQYRTSNFTDLSEISKEISQIVQCKDVTVQANECKCNTIKQLTPLTPSKIDQSIQTQEIKQSYQPSLPQLKSINNKTYSQKIAGNLNRCPQSNSIMTKTNDTQNSKINLTMDMSRIEADILDDEIPRKFRNQPLANAKHNLTEFHKKYMMTKFNKRNVEARRSLVEETAYERTPFSSTHGSITKLNHSNNALSQAITQALTPAISQNSTFINDEGSKYYIKESLLKRIRNEQLFKDALAELLDDSEQNCLIIQKIADIRKLVNQQVHTHLTSCGKDCPHLIRFFKIVNQQAEQTKKCIKLPMHNIAKIESSQLY